AWPTSNTDHGMLVAFGEFLQQHGLLERLHQVPISQKTRTFAPQAKLIEFLAGILSGIEHLQDLNNGPHPLARDQCVAQAWGQERFAHYSSVSRTLAVADDQTVAAVEAAITAFSRPFIETSVHELLRRGQRLVYDFDLSGQAVSSTSTTYPEAAFGWMNDQVRLGYQLARVCLSPQTGERVWLAGFHHPGDTVSATCLQELLRAAEAQTGVRPRRRPELVGQRIEELQAGLERIRRLIAQQQSKLDQLNQTQTTLIGKCYHAAQVPKEAIPAGKLALLQKQVASWQKRQPRLTQQIALAQRVLAEHQTRLVEQESQLAQLRAWQTQLTADNQANPDPPPHIEARMDAGFASGENLTWLLEMGYWPDTKAPNGRTTTVLRAQLPRTATWQVVGDNAEMVLSGEHRLSGCPYPLSLAVERFKIGSHFKYATLVRYGPAPKLAVWFAHYNARQSIEAGNKEMKSTFHVQHLMSHSSAGIRLQVVFTGLAANVVRWCRPWLQNCAAEPTPTVIRMLKSTKHLVRVAANSAALVQQTSAGLGLLFAPASALPGAIFCLRGVDAFQLPLGFHQPYKITSDSTKGALVAQNLR
ncbi:MAG: hypothetical protein ABI847_12880, partial [Anaerolineales bacterium]